MNFKKNILKLMISVYALSLVSIKADQVLPNVFSFPKEPVSSALSCSTCASAENTSPTLSENGICELKVDLYEYSLVGNVLLQIDLGRKMPFNPTEKYQLILPVGKKGAKGTIIARFNQMKIGFKTTIDKIGQVRFYSENYPGYSIFRENDFLVVEGKKRHFLFKSNNGGYSWKLFSIRNKNFHGKKITCEYNNEGLMTAIILPNNQKYKIFYKNGLAVKIESPDHAVTDIKWDEKSHIRQIKTVLMPNHPFYPKRKNKFSRKKPFTIRSLFSECDRNGRLISLINTDGEKFTAEYRTDKNKNTGNAELTGILKYPDNSCVYVKIISNPKTSYRAAEAGKMIINKKGKEEFIPNEEVYYTRKARTMVIDRKVKKGRITKYRRNSPTTAITAETNALGQTTKYTYNAKGLKTAVVYPDKTEKQYSYDNQNRLIETKDQLGRLIKYVYKNGIPAATNKFGAVTQYFYNADNKPVKTILPDQNIHQFTWDNIFRMVSHTKPDGVTVKYHYAGSLPVIKKIETVSNDKKKSWAKKFAYEPHGRISEIIYPDKTSEKFFYNCCNLVKTLDRADAVTKYIYNEAHKKVAEISPNGEKTQYVYDKEYRVIKVINPNKTEVNYEYDEYGNKVKVTNPDKTWVKYTYNALNIKTKDSGK